MKQYSDASIAPIEIVGSVRNGLPHLGNELFLAKGNRKPQLQSKPFCVRLTFVLLLRNIWMTGDLDFVFHGSVRSAGVSLVCSRKNSCFYIIVQVKRRREMSAL